MKTLITSILLATIASSSFAGQDITPLQDYLVKYNAITKASTDAVLADRACYTDNVGTHVSNPNQFSKTKYTICAVGVHDNLVQTLKDLTGKTYKGTINEVNKEVAKDLSDEGNAINSAYEH